MNGFDASALSSYYSSPEWAKKRNERLKIDGYKCAKCGFTRALEVHHINYDRLYNEDVSRDLVTLCKRCHNEIEKQKKTLNPIPKPSEHHSVYLAGKISRNDWRNKICSYWGIPDNPHDIIHDVIVDVNDSLSITGPFFIACDHGCYHGNGTHGVGAVNSLHSNEWGGCMGNYYTRNDVFHICKRQIDKAEIMFAYINCRDCYGTIAEIGYAHASDKEIVIVFSSPELKEEMWFIDKMQKRTGAASDEWIWKNLISRFEEVY